MTSYEIQSDLEAIAKNAALYQEANFRSRVEAIDDIEFHIIDRIDGLLHTSDQLEELTRLKQAAERLKHQLEAVNTSLLQQIRADIRTGCTGIALKTLINTYIECDPEGSSQQDALGYDSSDVFINGLLLTRPAPVETKAREPEMVYYQQTPARIILALIRQAHLTPQDVFYDLGSGLGQVPILVHLLSGATAKGVEFEPAYCAYASMCAAELNLSWVEFIHIDARKADYSDGTVFFMYTPFTGNILQEVLEKLRIESQKRMVRLFTYGPCTAKIFQQSWLKCIGQNENSIDKLSLFRSL